MPKRPVLQQFNEEKPECYYHLTAIKKSLPEYYAGAKKTLQRLVLKTINLKNYIS